MPDQILLARIRRLLADSDIGQDESIAHGFEAGQLRVSSHLFIDQQVAREIRGFQAGPVSEWTVRKLAKSFDRL